MNFNDNSQQKKMVIFFSCIIRFRTYLNNLDQKIKTALFEKGGGVCISLTRKSPDLQIPRKNHIFFSKMFRIKKNIDPPPPSEMVIFSWKISNVLKHMKGHNSDFFNHLFFELWWKIIDKKPYLKN